MAVWLSIRDTGTPLGRGVFAERAFAPGNAVEVCPVLLIDSDLRSIPEPVRRIVFNWPGDHYALVLGYGSIYNHSDDPNLSFSRDLKKLTMTFTALMPIDAGDQLTIDYNQMTGDQSGRKDWFRANQVEKLEPRSLHDRRD